MGRNSPKNSLSGQGGPIKRPELGVAINKGATMLATDQVSVDARFQGITLETLFEPGDGKQKTKALLLNVKPFIFCLQVGDGGQAVLGADQRQPW